MDTPESDYPERSIPLLEEVVNVSKRKITTGTVRIEKTVESRDHLVTESLRRESAVIERVPLGTTVDADNPPQARFENGMTIIPVLEEVLVVEKRLILKEELRIRQTVDEVTVNQQVTLNKEHLVLHKSESNEPGEVAEASHGRVPE